MKVLFDTSILIAAFIQSHTQHKKALENFNFALSKNNILFVAAHSIAECYSVLTRIPLSPRISPMTAKQLIEENIQAHARIITLTQKEYVNVMNSCAALGFSGGLIYDALIFQAAKKAKVEKLITLNEKHFKLFCKEQPCFISSDLI